MTQTILCFGEILWDCFSYGRFLGGAPLNVAYHLKQMGASPYIISSVGTDDLGNELLKKLVAYDLPTNHISKLHHLPTGTVTVSLNKNKDAEYTIVEPVAWDEITVNETTVSLAQTSDCIIYSTLNLRKEHNRPQLLKLLTATKGLKIFDANLRAPYVYPDIFFEFAKKADVIKVNHEELLELTNTIDEATDIHQTVLKLSALTNVTNICVTMGKNGAGFLNNNEWTTISSPKTNVIDTVGAGDSFLAALTLSLLKNPADIQQALTNGCHIGSYVASCQGATPSYDFKI